MSRKKTNKKNNKITVQSSKDHISIQKNTNKEEKLKNKHEENIPDFPDVFVNDQKYTEEKNKTIHREQKRNIKYEVENHEIENTQYETTHYEKERYKQESDIYAKENIETNNKLRQNIYNPNMEKFKENNHVDKLKNALFTDTEKKDKSVHSEQKRNIKYEVENHEIENTQYETTHYEKERYKQESDIYAKENIETNNKLRQNIYNPNMEKFKENNHVDKLKNALFTDTEKKDKSVHREQKRNIKYEVENHEIENTQYETTHYEKERYKQESDIYAKENIETNNKLRKNIYNSNIEKFKENNHIDKLQTSLIKTEDKKNNVLFGSSENKEKRKVYKNAYKQYNDEPLDEISSNIQSDKFKQNIHIDKLKTNIKTDMTDGISKITGSKIKSKLDLNEKETSANLKNKIKSGQKTKYGSISRSKNEKI